MKKNFALLFLISGFFLNVQNCVFFRITGAIPNYSQQVKTEKNGKNALFSKNIFCQTHYKIFSERKSARERNLIRKTTLMIELIAKNFRKRPNVTRKKYVY